MRESYLSDILRFDKTFETVSNKRRDALERARARSSLVCQEFEAVSGGRNNSRIGEFATSDLLRRTPADIHRTLCNRKTSWQGHIASLLFEKAFI